MQKKRETILIIIALLLIISVTFYTAINKGMRTVYKKIGFEDMNRIIKENNITVSYLVDVRTEEEYKEERIPGSILIPDFEIEKIQEVIKDKDAYIFLYCRSGRRSEISAKKIINMGYKNVFDMGGIIEYKGETISDKK